WNPHVLKKAIDDAGLPVIGKAKSGKRHTVNVYEKAAVDSLEYVKEKKQHCTLNDNGVISIGHVLCIGVSRYAQKNGMTHRTLQKAIDDAAAAQKAADDATKAAADAAQADLEAAETKRVADLAEEKGLTSG
ncbi:MAG: hypothetical protein IIB54_15695, partial [Planctomycetes bacterium]|nr:hypothetical protein [Planctomycetota bacterium]